MKFSKTAVLFLALCFGFGSHLKDSQELTPSSPEKFLVLVLTACYYIGLPFYLVGKTAFEYFVLFAHFKEGLVEQVLCDFPSVEAAIQNTQNYAYHAWTTWPLNFEETILYGMLFWLICYSVIMTSRGSLVSKYEWNGLNGCILHASITSVLVFSLVYLNKILK